MPRQQLLDETPSKADIRQLSNSHWIDTAALSGAIHLGVAAILCALLVVLAPAAWPEPVAWLLAIVLPSLALIVVHQWSFRRGGGRARQHRRLLHGLGLLPGTGWAVAFAALAMQPQPVLLYGAGAAFALVAVATAVLVVRWQEVLLALAPGLVVVVIIALARQQPETTALALAMVVPGAIACVLAMRQRHLILNAALTGEELRLARDRNMQLENQHHQLSRTRDYLLAAISHDLRQPAQAISLLSHGIHDAAPTAHVREAARDLSQVSDKVNDLVARLLDVARLDFSRKAVQPAWISLDEVFIQLRATLERRAEQAGVRIELVEPALLVRADNSILDSVFLNLVTNAIEHAGATLVSVEVTRPRRADETLRIHIIDNGRGLDAARMKLINRPDTSTTRTLLPTHSVHGLGLHLASRLARLGGHRLAVKATEGVGSCFTLFIDQWKHQRVAAAPVAPTSAIQAGVAATVIPIHRARPAWRQPRRQVLIIEDDALVRVALLSMLNSAGFDVTACDSGGDAIDAIHSDGCNPDIIISDWFLANGLTAENAMPGVQAALPSVVPVIVLTGMQSCDLSDQELSKRMGGAAVRFLRKPVRVELLIRRMRELLDEAASL